MTLSGGCHIILGIDDVDQRQPDGGGDGDGDFTLSVGPAPPYVRQGRTLDITVTATRAAGFTDAITLAVEGLGAGVSATGTIMSGSDVGELSLTADEDAVQGTFEVTVRGTSGDLMAAAALRFLVAGSPGSLDLSFSSDGIVVPAVGGLNAARGLVLQADGKILVPASTATGASVMRLLDNGSLDANFGTDGVASKELGGITGAIGATQRSDGSIVLAGFSGASGTNYAVFGFTPAGAVDLSFGTDGVGTLTPPGDAFSELHQVHVGVDGSVYSVGAQFANPMLSHLVRFDSSGQNGTLLDTVAGFLESVLLLSDGSFAAAGSAAGNFLVRKYTASGQLDTTFSTDGSVAIAIPGTAHGLAQVGDKILVAGTRSQAGVLRAAFARLNSDGTLDTTFGNNGIVISTVAMNSRSPEALVVDAVGNMYYAGNVELQPAIARFRPDGTLDTNWGGGLIVTDYGEGPFNGASHFGVAIDADGRIVVAAAVGPQANTTVVARFWP